jgi:glycosyltransferase involved in cell wall biosynthesis
LLTVLIATHNGEKTLPRTLESFLDLEDPRGGWHVVIVDNGSVDSTPDIIDSFTARLPLTHLSEPRTGKNRALNAGLASVQGNLVVFTDDDVIADRRWLSSLRACADERPQYAIIGGPVLPKWPAPPDTWILNSVKLNAVVRHIIRPHHLTEEWILQKGVHWARSQLILESRHPDVYDVGPLASPTSALWRLGPSLALQAARTLYSGAVGEPEHAFRERWKLSLLRGQSQALRSLIAAHQPAARPTLH